MSAQSAPGPVDLVAWQWWRKDHPQWEIIDEDEVEYAKTRALNTPSDYKVRPLYASPVGSPKGGDGLTDERRAMSEWQRAFDEARDDILNDRGPLEGENMTSEQTNAVLSILDSYFMPHLKRAPRIDPKETKA